MLDRTNENTDKKLASHILSLYTRPEDLANLEMLNESKPIIERDLLAKYISYARNYKNPEISAECVDELVNAYV